MFKRLFITLSLLCLLLSGCQFTSFSFLASPTPQPSATETLQPTFTPLPTATATPTPIPQVRIDQADQALFLGDIETGLKEYQTAFLQAITDEERAASLTGIGYSQYLLGNYKEAIDAFNTILEIYPTGYHIPKTYYYLGQAQYAQGDYLAAASAWEGYLRINPGVIDDTIQELRGDALKEAGEIEDASAAYQSAVSATSDGDTIDLEIKLARLSAQGGDYESALRLYNSISEKSDNDYVKAQMNFLSGQAYLELGLPEQAYARFQDSVEKYPMAYDTYSGMQALLAAGQPVDDMLAGLVYYYMGEYGKAIDSFQAYLRNNPEHDGTAHYYLAFCLIVMEDMTGALDQWQQLINDHPDNEYWEEAWDETAYTQWAHLGEYDKAAQTYLDFVSQAPNSPEAPQYLYWAARLYEMNLRLEPAAQTWERMIVEYPSDDLSFRGLFLAGVSYYRLDDYQRAQTTFQRLILLEPDAETLAGAHLWMGKIHVQQKDQDAARQEWQTAAAIDPTGYYSERAQELLDGKKPLEIDPESYELEFDLDAEQQTAEEWLRRNFEIPAETDLNSLSVLQSNTYFQRGNAFYDLGLYDQAGAEYEKVRLEVEEDPVNSYRLLNYLLERGFYRHAILLSRQILDLGHFDDDSTLLAPAFFNHIRFGLYFKELIVPAAEEAGFDPLLLFSLVRQESFFEFFAGSSAGAIGLMQIVPSTGQEMANYLNWPGNYQDADLYKPVVNIDLGTWYLKRQLDQFGSDDIYVSLAAYNGGPSNADNWYSLAGDDPDLFLEIVRFSETRDYIMLISEAVHLYEQIYSK
ncbi:MAG: tetratricopeptide repeat protein [Chloroflexi bacterium]|nr:tetratricopeptide repeat protein [Chloroflexota bacterium]